MSRSKKDGKIIDLVAQNRKLRGALLNAKLSIEEFKKLVDATPRKTRTKRIVT